MADAGAAQVARDLAADAAEAADDEVVCVGVDHALGPPLVEQAAELAGDEELRHRRQAVEERTYAEQLQSDDHDPPGGVMWVLDRAERGDRVERPGERVATEEPSVMKRRSCRR